MSTKKLKILVVDDSVVYRKIVRDVLFKIPDIEIVGVASNGKLAVDKIELLKPDLLTLDLEMPEMNGIDVLKYINKKQYSTGAIMLSGFTHEGAQVTMDALSNGAFDFIVKPGKSTLQENQDKLYAHLLPVIEAYRGRQCSGVCELLERQTRQKKIEPFYTKPIGSLLKQAPDIIAIGVSTGGPVALTQLLSELPASYNVPIVIVQHMPSLFTKSLATQLNSVCQQNVCEAEDGQLLQPGSIYIAPGGYQMKVITDQGRSRICITDDPPIESCKPSVNYLFESVADVYKRRALGIILTGMGQDGMQGCKRLYKEGAMILTQEESSCVVYGMPKAVVEAGVAHYICSIEEVVEKMVEASNCGVTL